MASTNAIMIEHAIDHQRDDLDLLGDIGLKLANMVEAEQETNAKTLEERMSGNTIDLFNYMKHDAIKSGTKSGQALQINKCHNLAIIDIDIKHSLDEESKEEIRNEFLNKLPEDVVVVKSANGGLHIYCNRDYYGCENRMVKCAKTDNYDVDIFVAADENSRSLIVLPGSKVRNNDKNSGKRGEMLHYSYIRNDAKSCLKHTVADLIKRLDITIVSKEVKEIVSEYTHVEISDKLVDVLINGLTDLVIHNDGRPLEEEITFFVLFQAINSLPADRIDEAYSNVYSQCDLTDNAMSNFEMARSRFSQQISSPYVLVKMYKIWKAEYYEEFVKPLLTRPFTKHNIDITDNFLLENVMAKAKRREYTRGLDEVAEDLTRVVRYIAKGTKSFIMKVEDEFTKRNKLDIVSRKDMTQNLKDVELWKRNGKQYTAWDAFKCQQDEFSVSGIRFYDNDPRVLTIFRGYKYNINETVNFSVIEPFINFIKEVISDNDETINEYMLNWISWIVQHPGQKSTASIVLKGLPGIGKNVFTNAICELFSGYTENVTDINELTGTFNSVVENKMLIILNELKNAGDDRMANFDALKGIISDGIVRINEKNIARRTAENVANFIFCTNNAFPIKVEAGDRRYLVLNVSGKYKEDQKYFGDLCGRMNEEFYTELLTYFSKRDISSYKILPIPMTEAKADLIEASMSPFDEFICRHYNELTTGYGMICNDAINRKPAEIKERFFRLDIKSVCTYERHAVNGVRNNYYKMKADCEKVYKDKAARFAERDIINEYVGEEEEEECDYIYGVAKN